MARVHPASRSSPEGRGSRGWRWKRPVVARGGDRFVLRSYSPVTTIGGGRVLDPLPPRGAALWPTGLAASGPGGATRARCSSAARAASRIAELPILLGMPTRRAAAVAARAAAGARQVGEHLDPRRRRSQDARRHGARASLKALSPGAAQRAGDAARDASPRPPRAATPSSSARWRTLLAPGGSAQRDGLAALAGFVPRVEGGDAEIDRDRPHSGGGRA